MILHRSISMPAVASWGAEPCGPEFGHPISRSSRHMLFPRMLATAEVAWSDPPAGLGITSPPACPASCRSFDQLQVRYRRQRVVLSVLLWDLWSPFLPLNSQKSNLAYYFYSRLCWSK